MVIAVSAPVAVVVTAVIEIIAVVAVGVLVIEHVVVTPPASKEREPTLSEGWDPRRPCDTLYLNCFDACSLNCVHVAREIRKLIPG